MRPSLRHKAPGSLSQGSNRQEFLSPGSVYRRVVPWGDVSSWVKGADLTFSLTSYGLCFINTTEILTLSFRGLLEDPGQISQTSAICLERESVITPPGRLNTCRVCRIGITGIVLPPITRSYDCIF